LTEKEIENSIIFILPMLVNAPGQSFLNLKMFPGQK